MAKVHESKFKIKYDWFVNTINLLNSKTYSSSVISARLRKLEEYFDVLTDAYEGILCSNLEAEVITGYEGKYKEATEAYNQLDAVSAAYPSLDGTHVPTESVTSSRLPRINLTSFDGDVFSWTSFISLFSSLVLSRRDISKTEKFHYLFSNVEKEPQSLIRHLPMVDSSLDTAMDILRGRYENKRLQADSYISRILHLPVLNKSLGLRTKILNPLLESTRALKNIGLPTDEWSYILLHISLTKLPLDIKTRFEQQYGGNNLNLPTFEQLTEFLHNECRLIDTATAEPVVSYADHARKPARTTHVTGRGNNNQNKSEWHNSRNYNSGKSTCAYCQLSGHSIGNCFKFADMSNNSRKEWIRAKGLCFRCFDKHAAASCSKKVPCNRCGNVGHNKLICTMSTSRSDRSVSPSENKSSRPQTSTYSNGIDGRMRQLLDSYERERERSDRRDEAKVDSGNRASRSRDTPSPVDNRKSRSQQ